MGSMPKQIGITVGERGLFLSSLCVALLQKTCFSIIVLEQLIEIKGKRDRLSYNGAYVVVTGEGDRGLGVFIYI